MPLDDDNSIKPLESKTIQAALAAVIINGLTLITVVSGKSFNVAVIQQYVDLYVPIVVNGITMFLGYRAIKGRMNATSTIAKKDNA